MSKNRNEMAATISMHNTMWHNVLMDNAAGEMVNNAGTLRFLDHQRIQETLVETRRLALNGIADLMGAGLTKPEDIGTMLSGYENINEFQEANVSMNPTALQNNQIDFSPAWVPLPIVHQGWKIPWRQTGFSYKNQIGMTESVRQVGVKLEDILFNGNSKIVINFQGAQQPLFGYTNHPDRLTFTISDWTDIATNRTNIITETVAMIGKLYNVGKVFQPNSVNMYVATDIWTGLQEDYSTAKGDKTLLERMEAVTEIRAIKPSISLAAGTVMLVEMSARTIELAVASDIVTIPHIRSNAIDDQAFTTYAAMTPQIKSDRKGVTGILHGTT